MDEHRASDETVVEGDPQPVRPTDPRSEGLDAGWPRTPWLEGEEPVEVVTRDLSRSETCDPQHVVTRR